MIENSSEQFHQGRSRRMRRLSVSYGHVPERAVDALVSELGFDQGEIDVRCDEMCRQRVLENMGMLLLRRQTDIGGEALKQSEELGPVQPPSFL